jgi:tetratricopeptide (TPR) repeat protein
MAYEQALRSGSAEISRHLPGRDDPSYVDTLRELILVDAEWSLRRGSPRSIDDYVRSFPELSADRALASSLRSGFAMMQASTPGVGVTRIDLDPGEVLAGFENVELLGRGAFARVYLAKQLALADRLVVIKVANRSFGEAQKLASLRHTNIVPLFSAHEVEGLHLLCMPYLGRTTLATSRDQARSAREVLTLVAGLADGLGHAHERGLLHLDIKPANVLIGDDGVPMLLDFNLSARADPGVVAAGGTLAYMSPEQIEQTNDAAVQLTPASDTYALGLLMFELLTGSPAFELPTRVNPDTTRQLAASRQGHVPDLRARTAGLAPSVRSIVARALHPEPALRYADGRELAEDLWRELADLPLVHAGSASWLERAGKWLRRHPRTGTALGVGAAAMVLVGVSASLYVARDRQLRTARAEQAVASFDRLSLRARTLLGVPAPSPAQLEAGRDAAREALGLFGLAGTREAHSPPASELDALKLRAGELLLLKSRAARIQARWETGESARALIDESKELNAQADLLLDDRLVELQRVAFEGDTDATADVLRRLDESQHPRADYLRGVLASAEGRWSDAAGCLESMVRRDPQDPSAWAALGHARYAMLETERALGAWRTASALAPDDAALHYFVGVARLSLDQHAQAIESFSRCIELDSMFAPAHADRGLARLLGGDAPASLSDFDRAFELDPRHTRSLILRAVAMERTGDARAAEAMAQSLSAEPGDEQSAVSRGVMRLDDPHRAVADFEAALRWNPQSLDAMQNLAYVHAERLADTARGVAWLDELLKSHPQHHEALTSRAVLHARLGRRDLALADAQRAMGLSLTPSLQYQLAGAFAHSAAGHPDDARQAIKLLREALRSGFGHDLIAADPDLRPLQGHPDLVELMRAASVIEGTNNDVGLRSR